MGRNGHRLSIVRPASSRARCAHPFPGWIDGFKVADPLIIAYGRGQLPEFPGLPDCVLDVIPVDFVVNAILAAAAKPRRRRARVLPRRLRRVATRCRSTRMYGNVNEYFTANPMPDDAAAPRSADLEVPRRPRRARPERAERGARRRERVLERLPSTRAPAPAARARPARSATSPSCVTSPSCTAPTSQPRSSSTTRRRGPSDALPPTDADDLGFDVAAIDWEDYMQHVHFPAITR